MRTRYLIACTVLAACGAPDTTEKKTVEKIDLPRDPQGQHRGR
ncbi:MAG: hypothetical protein QM724_09400 [Flavobacteriales bacterium]